MMKVIFRNVSSRKLRYLGFYCTFIFLFYCKEGVTCIFMLKFVGVFLAQEIIFLLKFFIKCFRYVYVVAVFVGVGYSESKKKL